VVYELRFGEALVLHARIEDGRLTVGEGVAGTADLVIEAGPGLKPLLAREVTPAGAIAAGSVRVSGDPALLELFVRIFFIA